MYFNILCKKKETLDAEFGRHLVVTDQTSKIKISTERSCNFSHNVNSSIQTPEYLVYGSKIPDYLVQVTLSVNSI